MAQSKPKLSKIKQSGPFSGTQVMFAAILSIGLILAINFSSRIADSQPIQEAHDRAEAQIEQLRDEQAELMALRDYVRSDAYVASWARSEGKMVRPGEVLIVPVPSGATIEPTPIPPISFEDVQTTPPEPETWTLWWSLFFDSAPPDLR